MAGRTAIGMLAAVLLLAAVGCDDDGGGGGSPSVPAPSASTSASPTPAAALALRVDGLGPVDFGDAMRDAFPLLVDALGPPASESREHGDLPYGYGGMDATVRRLDFGGLYVVFGDWSTPYRDAGEMHLLGWGATAAVSGVGTPLETPEGIGVGSSVADLREAMPSIDLTVEPGCGGPPWYFWAGPGSYLVSLSASPSKAGAVVTGLFGGEQREGFATC